MPERKNILKELDVYEAINDEEEGYRKEIITFVKEHEDCFEHFCKSGHVTGSGLLVSKDGKKVLLNHHKELGIWIQFGGHADGEGDVLNVAFRETMEESGIEAIEAVSNDILDIDIHVIPVNNAKNKPEHLHYDVRYLFRVTDDSDYVLSDESNELRWCNYEEALGLADSAKICRMLNKWHDGSY